MNTVHYRNKGWDANQVAEKDFGTAAKKKRKVIRKQHACLTLIKMTEDLTFSLL